MVGFILHGGSAALSLPFAFYLPARSSVNTLVFFFLFFFSLEFLIRERNLLNSLVELPKLR